MNLPSNYSLIVLFCLSVLEERKACMSIFIFIYNKLSLAMMNYPSVLPALSNLVALESKLPHTCIN